MFNLYQIDELESETNGELMNFKSADSIPQILGLTPTISLENPDKLGKWSTIEVG